MLARQLLLLSGLEAQIIAYRIVLKGKSGFLLQVSCCGAHGARCPVSAAAHAWLPRPDAVQELQL